jgi:hypothetical protein
MLSARHLLMAASTPQITASFGAPIKQYPGQVQVTRAVKVKAPGMRPHLRPHLRLRLRPHRHRLPLCWHRGLYSAAAEAAPLAARGGGRQAGRRRHAA